MRVSPFLRLMKSSTIPELSGPGRCSATMGISSLKARGLSLSTRSVMPADSTWNTPSVFPLESRS